MKNDPVYKHQHYLKNRDLYLARAKLWQQENKEKKRLYDKERRSLEGDLLREYDRMRAELPHRKALKRNHTRKRVMAIKQATPNWMSEFDLFVIQEMYDLAVRRSTLLGIDFDVDHILPLHGKTICGLHVPSNLQILERAANIKKSNKTHFELI